MKRPSRRRFLAAASTAAAAIPLAGCSSNSGDGTATGTTPPTMNGTATQQPTTTQDTSGSGEPVGVDQLRQWIPVMDAFEFDVPAAVFYDGDITAMAEHQGDFFSGAFDQIGQTLLGPGLANIVPAESRERAIQVASAYTVILETSMSDEELGSALTDAGLSESGSQDDATIYEGQVNGSPSANAVVNGVVVQSFGSNGRASVEAVLGARSGATARLLPNNADVRTLVEQVGESELLVVSERASDSPSGDPSLEGATVLGYGWQFGASTTNIRLGVTYTEGQTGDPTAVTEYFTSQDRFADYSGFESSTQGRTILITGEIDTAKFDLLSSGTPGGGSEAPQVQFGFEYSDATLTVTHEGGDNVPASELSLFIGDGPAGTQFEDEYDEFTAGDSISLDISNFESGTNVLVIWSSGGSGQILAQSQIP